MVLFLGRCDPYKRPWLLVPIASKFPHVTWRPTQYPLSIVPPWWATYSCSSTGASTRRRPSSLSATPRSCDAGGPHLLRLRLRLGLGLTLTLRLGLGLGLRVGLGLGVGLGVGLGLGLGLGFGFRFGFGFGLEVEGEPV